MYIGLGGWYMDVVLMVSVLMVCMYLNDNVNGLMNGNVLMGFVEVGLLIVFGNGLMFELYV